MAEVEVATNAQNAEKTSKNECFSPWSPEATNFQNVFMCLFVTVYIPEEVSHQMLPIGRKAHSFILKIFLPCSSSPILSESIVRKS